MKKIIYGILSLAILFSFSCSNIPSQSKIKEDLVGITTYRQGLQYWWVFEKTSEIKEVKIVSKVQSEDTLELVTDLVLVDENNGNFSLNLTMFYKKDNKTWKLDRVFQNRYAKID